MLRFSSMHKSEATAGLIPGRNGASAVVFQKKIAISGKSCIFAAHSKKELIMKKSFTKIIHVVAACLLLSQSVVSCQKDEKNDRHALVGLFSISPTQQVRFAPGNLQYQASTNTWRFAEHQWDVIGSDNSDISSTYSGWIDLFGWGTSGWNSGANCYQPWSVSVDDSDYFPGGSPNND